jgi:hypothetical protein
MNKERIHFWFDVDLSFIICFFPDEDCILSCFSHFVFVWYQLRRHASPMKLFARSSYS